MIDLKSKCGKAPESLLAFTDDIPQLNSTSFLPDSALEEVLKAYLYTPSENATRLILLAQATAKTDEKHYIQTKNAVSIDAQSVTV